MTDDRLQQLIDDAMRTYRVPAEPPLDAIWARIEREHFDTADAVVLSAAQSPRWRRTLRTRWLPLIAAAATLAIGIGIGRATTTRTREPALPAVADAAQAAAQAVAQGAAQAAAIAAEPLQRATSDYLDETVALLASLPRTPSGGRLAGDVRFVAQAAELLGTTRLLLDSPAATDPRLRDLLEDLELVLAQVARLRAVPRADELTFIAEAMDERDVVPRLRTVAASLSASGY